MNIIIPIGGKGQRFKNEGYLKSKPLIHIFEKPMIFYVLDNLYLTKNDNIYIIYNIKLEKDNFHNIIKSKYPQVNLIQITKDTKGAAETLFIGLNGILDSIKICKKNIILDCDTFYKQNIIDIYRKSKKNNIVFFSKKKNEEPIYSYIEIDSKNKIIDIKEKCKISDNANTGAYCFESIKTLCKYCKYVLENNIQFNNEPYTSCVINEMIKKNENFFGIQLDDDKIISLGTPLDVKKYIKNTKVLLFDLDGTLVNSDYIYINVWKTILEKYNLNCNEKFFDYFIKGKSDVNFMKYINKSISISEIKKISKEKDNSFIKLLKKNKIIFDGVLNFFEKNKFNKIAIVTSCNKKAAKYILKKTKLDKFIDLLIASEDCSKHKPDPEPYLKAIDFFKVENKGNIFIFEDSYSGFCSAKRTNIRNICLIENDNSCDEIIKSNHFKYNDYGKINLEDVVNFYNNKSKIYKNDYIKEIKETIKTIPIKKIMKNKKNLKTGYICDINSYNITYLNGNNENIVLKISNFENELSKTAVKLNMYENETYFYDKISVLLKNVPKYFGTFRDNKKDAIILEDLNKYNGKFNIDLNNNINLLLNVVKNIHDIHKSFYFKNKKEIIPCMKNLKKINEISYYKELINKRFKIFENNVKCILDNNEKIIIKNIYNNIDKIYEEASSFPLSFCHGDLKSPNIFYKNNNEPIFLDWQYIHLNKGISDIVFLLVESIEFNKITVDIVINFYYKLQNEIHPISYENYINDFKNALCIFPFFVSVWFNSESSDKLLDPIFPIKFLKNLMKYYNYYLS